VIKQPSSSTIVSMVAKVAGLIPVRESVISGIIRCELHDRVCLSVRAAFLAAMIVVNIFVAEEI